MARYQLSDPSGRKYNIIEWDGETPFTPPQGHTLEPDDGTPMWTPPPSQVSLYGIRKALRTQDLLDDARADPDLAEALDYLDPWQLHHGQLLISILDKDEAWLEDLFRDASAS